MSELEKGGQMPPIAVPETLDPLYESFRLSVADEIRGSLAMETDLVDCADQIDRLTKLCPEATIGLLENARLAIAVNGINEDNYFDVCRIAEVCADVGMFDEALAIGTDIDTYDPPKEDESDYITALFRFHGKKIPDKYLERAVLAIASDGHDVFVLDELYDLGERYPAIRGLVLGLAEQVLTEHMLPAAESPEAADQGLEGLACFAASCGDLAAAKVHYDKMRTPAHRLRTELEIYQRAKVLLDHQDLQQVYDAIVGSGDAIAGSTKVTLLLDLHEAGYAVDGGVVLGILDGMEDDTRKLRLTSKFAAMYKDADAYRRLVDGITEQTIEKDSFWVRRMAKQHPGLLADCEPVILSFLIKGELSRSDQRRMVVELLDDFIAAGRLDEAIALANSLEPQKLFRGVRHAFEAPIVEAVARKGREHFDEALAKVAEFSKGNHPYRYQKLLSDLVVAAHDYLSPDEREAYLQACGGGFMTFRGWIQLSKSTKRLDYLVHAKQVLEPERQALEDASTYREHLLQLLDAYQQITAKPEQAETAATDLAS